MLVYVKRVVVWVFQRLTVVFGGIATVYRRTVGFRLYKVIFFFKKYIDTWGLKKSEPIKEYFGRRGVLQIFALVIALFMLYPQSKYYVVSASNNIPAQNTLLYSMLGPGDQEVDLEEVTAVPNLNQNAENLPSWRQGAVVNSNVSAGTTRDFQGQAAVGTAFGGTAFIKPILMPGYVLPGSAGSPTGRIEMATYTVEPGDVIGSIAKKFDVSVATILWANNLRPNSLIRIGDKLKILPVDGVAHIVKKGDTLAKIAKLYGAKEENIIAFNKLQPDGTDIVIGEELIVPDGVNPQAPQPVPATTRRYTALDTIAAPPQAVAGGFLWPTSVHRITQYFSWRHTGIDIGGPKGTPLYAAKNGTVTRASCGWNGGYGCYTVIDHGGGVQTAYGHATEIYVHAGEQVVQGQVFAAMGSTGHSTGPHLHFEVRVNGKRVNPLSYVR